MATMVHEHPVVLTRLADLQDREDIAGQFQDLRGYHVLSTTGHPVGEVVDVYVDTKMDEIGLVALRFHGGGDRPWLHSSRTVLVPFGDVEVFGDHQVRVKRAQDELAGAPEFQENAQDFRKHVDYWKGSR